METPHTRSDEGSKVQCHVHSRVTMSPINVPQATRRLTVERLAVRADPSMLCVSVDILHCAQ